MCHNPSRGTAYTTRPDPRRRARARCRRRAPALPGPALAPLGAHRRGGLPARRARRVRHAGHAGSGHAAFRDDGMVDHAAQRLRPPRDRARLRLGEDAADGERARGARVGAGRARPRDRDRARACASRPGPTTGGSPARRCAAARASGCGSRSSTAPSTRTRSTSTASTRPRWTASRASAPGTIDPGGKTVYEFDALPAGLHLYHCHVRPLAEHISKGLYGAFIVDPRGRRARRPTSC